MSRASSATSRASPKPGSNTPTALRRLTHELTSLRTTPNPSVLHLGPSTDTDLFTWEAVLKGPPPPSPYSGGLWLLSIHIPTSYPLTPPNIKFRTPICHANIHFDTGEICLSLLTSEHWSPSYTLSSTMSAIQQLLADPGLDSPLNVDAGNLLREDDALGMESLVRFWTCERRWQGEGQAGWISERNDNVRGGAAWGTSTAGHLDPTRQTVNEREADAGALAEKGGRETVSPGTARRTSSRSEGSSKEKEKSGGEGRSSARDSKVSVDSRGSISHKSGRPSTGRDESGLDVHGIPKRSEIE